MKILRKRKSLLLLTILLVSSYTFKSCTEDPYKPETLGSIEGQVMDAETNSPLANVTITTQPSTEVILTDETGFYQIANIDTGRYSVVAEKEDYERKMLGILVKEDHVSNVNFLLKKSDAASGDIEFTGSFYPSNGAEDLPPTITLSWKAMEGRSSDSLSYDVELFNSENTKQYYSAEEIRDTSLTVEALQYNKVYYWQVSAYNKRGDTTRSEIRSFKTRGISQNAFYFVRKVDGNFEIMAYDRDNELVNRITYNSYRDWAPRINRDNNMLAFVNNSELKSHLYTMTRNGENITRITNIEVTGYHNQGDAFDWDEQRGKIIFSHYENLYEVNADGTGLQKIATAPAGRHFRECRLSPDNSQIVAVTMGSKIYDSEIYLLNRDGTNPQLLVDNLDGIVASPSFSIDGESILYTHDVSGNQTLEGRMLNSHIFRYDLASGTTTDLSTNKPLGTNDLTPTYSPTGNKILFTNVVNDGSQPKEIWMMDINGDNREKVVDDGELPNWK